MAKINYENLKEIECQYCKITFKPTGPAQKYCVDCLRHIENLNAQVKRDIIRFNKFGTYKSIGKGGTQPKGVLSPHYKHGISFFMKTAKKVKETIRYCERCGEDLKYASRYYYCIHHRDHDRTNNTLENFELLCKRCHQLHHGCVDNLLVVRESATTILKESTLKWVEAVGIRGDDDIVCSHGKL
jgi:hypothetical protein